jgi:hypothetical protein
MWNSVHLAYVFALYLKQKHKKCSFAQYINRIVNFKGNRAERHACASSNICRMPYAITVWTPAGAPKNPKWMQNSLAVLFIHKPVIRNKSSTWRNKYYSASINILYCVSLCSFNSYLFHLDICSASFWHCFNDNGICLTWNDIFLSHATEWWRGT